MNKVEKTTQLGKRAQRGNLFMPPSPCPIRPKRQRKINQSDRIVGLAKQVLFPAATRLAPLLKNMLLLSLLSHPTHITLSDSFFISLLLLVCLFALVYKFCLLMVSTLTHKG